MCSFPHASAACQDGTCALGACEGDWRNCDNSDGNGCETDTSTDLDHCGVCNSHCRLDHASTRCLNGSCILETCDADWGDCDSTAENGCETNLLHDLDHCGACGNSCDRATHLCGGSGTRVKCDVCADGCQFNSVQAAVSVATAGDTIRICAGDWVLTTSLVVDKDLTLVGAGAEHTTLDGNDAVRVLAIGDSGLVEQPTLTVRGLTITHGRVSDDFGNLAGGGVHNDGTLTLIDVIVAGNFADSAGGIWNGGVLYLVDSSVKNNTTKYSGAGIFNTGSEGRGTLSLLRSIVQGNTAQWEHWGGDGGGIYNYVGTVTMEASRVTGNTAHSGGGILNLGQGVFSSAIVTLKAGSTVSDNIGNFGGGIRNNFGTVRLESGSRVEGNSAGAGGGIGNTGRVNLAEGTKVTGNTAGSIGGGIDNSGGNPQAGATLATTDIVTDNYLAGGTTASNCFPVNTTPNCIG